VRFLLTSAGLRNQTLRGVLHDMLGKPFASANVVYVPTASFAEPGDHGWFVADLNRLHGLGWREFDIVELNGLPRQMVLDRLLHADVIDDETAIRVDGDEMDVISEGRWRFHP
jgi:dipeptidase E